MVLSIKKLFLDFFFVIASSDQIVRARNIKLVKENKKKIKIKYKKREKRK